MWQLYAFIVAESTIGRLPRSIGYIIARIIADWVYIFFPRTRDAVRDNMEHVLGPQTDTEKLTAAVRCVLRNAAKNYFDLISMAHLELSEIERRMNVVGLHNLKAAVERGKGVILVTAHLGSFDIALQLLATYSIKTTVLVEALDPPALFKHVTGLRERNGLTCVPVQLGILKSIMEALKRGEVVLLACDRDIGKEGPRTVLFNEETTLPSGAVRIAERTGAAIVPVFNLRRDDGRYDVYFEPELEIVQGGKSVIKENQAKITQIMERFVSMCPEQWVVLDRVWHRENDVSSLAKII